MKLNIGNQKKHAIQSDMIGLFFEDINYAADGGLYAEMLENRSFEFLEAFGEETYNYYKKYVVHMTAKEACKGAQFLRR